jgi:hypothetical protein
MSSPERGPKRAWPWPAQAALALVLALGVLGWVSTALWGDAQRAWGIFLVDFLFLMSLSAGLVVWPAVVVASRGRWMGSTQRTALSGVVLLPVCVCALVLLFTEARHWAPWWHQDLPNRFWLNMPFLVTRDVICLVVFTVLAFWFSAALHRGHRPARLAGWLLFVYALAFSILGIDLVMALDPHWTSLVFGMYFFISGLYLAAAAWTLATVLADPQVTADQLDDQAKLIVTFSLLTTYMMYCQLLPIWFENMPHETRYLAPRMNAITQWPAVSAVLLAVIYLGPLVLFLPRRGKRSGVYVGVVSALVLAGMWVERWWLVMPSLGMGPRFGIPEAAGLGVLLSGGLLLVGWLRTRMPPAGARAYADCT